MTNDWLENFSQEILDKLDTYTKVKYPIYVPSKARSDLKLTTQALEDVALESANVAKEVSKEVFNPLAKFTKVIHQYFVV